MPTPARNLTGKLFGEWTVLFRAPNYTYSSGNSVVAWQCRCSCGTEKTVSAHSLTTGQSVCCGCKGREKLRVRATRHGATVGYRKNKKTKEYRAWSGAKSRCYNPKATGYANYGGRGIGMSPLWRKNFPKFLEDLGPCPAKHSLERIKNDRDYEPGNCRWASRLEQVNNRRNTVFIEINGTKIPLAEFARLNGLKHRTLAAAFWRASCAAENLDNSGETVCSGHTAATVPPSP